MTSFEIRMKQIPFDVSSLIDPISLTYSPNIFYEMLEREIRRCERTESEISLIAIDLSMSEISSQEMIEVLIKISIIIRQKLRSDEFFSRIGLETLVILIHGNELEASKVLDRLKDGFTELEKTMNKSSNSLQVSTKIIKRKRGFNLIDWLEVAAL
jgi:diguanylate cyclase (GGDEF)-like protein